MCRVPEVGARFGRRTSLRRRETLDVFFILKSRDLGINSIGYFRTVWISNFVSKRGKTPGTQVQHELLPEGRLAENQRRCSNRNRNKLRFNKTCPGFCPSYCASREAP